jgi:hypothetical protein
VRSYEMHNRVWLIPVISDVPLDRLNSAHVESVLARIEQFNAELKRQRAEGKALIKIEGDLRFSCGHAGRRLSTGSS